MALFTLKNVLCQEGIRTILHIDDLVLHEGGSLLLRGASGSGKTTFLSLLSGLRRPSEGHVSFRGQDLSSFSRNKLDRLRGRSFGFVMQGFFLIRHLSVMDNIRLARYAAGLAPDDGKIMALLQRLNIEDRAQAQASSLSTGETQRVAIVRALANDPAVIIADEPTSALDDDNAGAVVRLLRQQAEQSKAALIVATHDSRIVSAFDQIITLKDGRMAK